MFQGGRKRSCRVTRTRSTYLKKCFKLPLAPIDFTSDALAYCPENVVSGMDATESSNIICSKPGVDSSDVDVSGGINVTGLKLKLDLPKH